MPLSNAEKQRRYRERRNANPALHAENKRKDRERNKRARESGKIKSIKDLTSEEKELQRSKWQERRQKYVRKCKNERARLAEATFSPPVSPDDRVKQEQPHSRSSESNQGKRDFGSFHASNVGELISMDDANYKPPPMNAVSHMHHRFQDYALDDLPVGSEAKKHLFVLEMDSTFINHGAFGAVLADALDSAQQWQRHMELQPLRFFDRELLPLLAYVTRRLAQFVGCDAKDLVLMQNATTATNTVLSSLKLKPGEQIFFLSCEYGAVKKNVQKLCKETGAEMTEAVLQFPLTSKDQILDLVRNKLKKGSRLAIFDHIPSNTPFIMPVKELADICHERGVRILIDGAHALGSIPLDISTLGVDYYTSNAHKWFCAPKGAAFLYVRKELQNETVPLIVSHGYESGFQSQFIWSGLRDYSPLLAILTVLDFHDKFGSHKLFEFMHNLAEEAANLLTAAWMTDRLVTDKKLSKLPMLCVRLQEELYNRSSSVDYKHAECVQNALYHDFNIEVPIKAIDGHLYARISCHLYNTLYDYSRLADAINFLTEIDYLHKKLDKL